MERGELLERESVAGGTGLESSWSFWSIANRQWPIAKGGKMRKAESGKRKAGGAGVGCWIENCKAQIANCKLPKRCEAGGVAGAALADCGQRGKSR